MQDLVIWFILSPIIVVGATALATLLLDIFFTTPPKRKRREMKKHNQCCKNCKHCILVGKLNIDCCDLSQGKEWDAVEGFITGDYQSCGECVGSKICKWELYRTV